MSASNSFENSILDLVFANVDFANIGDAAGLQNSAAAGSLYLSLHTTPGPGEAGDQTTNEATYTSYARIAVARSGAGWTVSGNSVVNAADATFPTAIGGPETETHFGVGTASSGAGVLLFSGTLSSSLAVSSGIAPVFLAGDLSVTAD